MSVCLRVCFSLSLSLSLSLTSQSVSRSRSPALEKQARKRWHRCSRAPELYFPYWPSLLTPVCHSSSVTPIPAKQTFVFYVPTLLSLSLSLSLSLPLSLSLSSRLLFDPVCPYKIPYYTRISVEYYDTKYTGVYGN
jgi:hypothetical protein